VDWSGTLNVSLELMPLDAVFVLKMINLNPKINPKLLLIHLLRLNLMKMMLPLLLELILTEEELDTLGNSETLWDLLKKPKKDARPLKKKLDVNKVDGFGILNAKKELMLSDVAFVWKKTHLNPQINLTMPFLLLLNLS